MIRLVILGDSGDSGDSSSLFLRLAAIRRSDSRDSGDSGDSPSPSKQMNEYNYRSDVCVVTKQTKLQGLASQRLRNRTRITRNHPEIARIARANHEESTGTNHQANHQESGRFIQIISAIQPSDSRDSGDSGDSLPPSGQ